MHPLRHRIGKIDKRTPGVTDADKTPVSNNRSGKRGGKRGRSQEGSTRGVAKRHVERRLEEQLDVASARAYSSSSDRV
jgi:hypothetical protein